MICMHNFIEKRFFCLQTHFPLLQSLCTCTAHAHVQRCLASSSTFHFCFKSNTVIFIAIKTAIFHLSTNLSSITINSRFFCLFVSNRSRVWTFQFRFYLIYLTSIQKQLSKSRFTMDGWSWAKTDLHLNEKIKIETPGISWLKDQISDHVLMS